MCHYRKSGAHDKADVAGDNANMSHFGCSMRKQTAKTTSLLVDGLSFVVTSFFTHTVVEKTDEACTESILMTLSLADLFQSWLSWGYKLQHPRMRTRKKNAQDASHHWWVTRISFLRYFFKDGFLPSRITIKLLGMIFCCFIFAEHRTCKSNWMTNCICLGRLRWNPTCFKHVSPSNWEGNRELASLSVFYTYFVPTKRTTKSHANLRVGPPMPPPQEMRSEKKCY